jgi:hypothetical protein
MSNTLLQALKQYNSSGGLINAGDVFGTDASTAAALIAAGTAQLYNAGSGSGTPTTSAFRGILASETRAQYATAGGTLGDQPVSAAVEGFLGGADVTIVDGRAVPNSEPWA